MFSPRTYGVEGGADAKKYDPSVNQWMREAMESRQVIEELTAQNEKLQREVYGLNAKLNLISECCGDLGMVDRLGDLMQRKLREFQAVQAARNAPPASVAPSAAVHPMGSPPRSSRRSGLGTSDDAFICGSNSFQDVATYASSYKGQVSRGNFHRVNMFEAEEAKLRTQLDIFGVPKLPLQQSGSYSPTRMGDTIDNLLSTVEAATSPLKSPKQDGSEQRPSPIGYSSVHPSVEGEPIPTGRGYGTTSYR